MFRERNATLPNAIVKLYYKICMVNGEMSLLHKQDWDFTKVFEVSL